MNVHLTPQLEELIQTKVQSGRYSSASEVVQEALRLMEERDQLLAMRKEELRKKIAAGYESLRRSEGIDGDEFFAALEREEEELSRKRA
jgi:antitoxin ParD1/3/4